MENRISGFTSIGTGKKRETHKKLSDIFCSFFLYVDSFHVSRVVYEATEKGKQQQKVRMDNFDVLLTYYKSTETHLYHVIFRDIIFDKVKWNKIDGEKAKKIGVNFSFTISLAMIWLGT